MVSMACAFAGAGRTGIGVGRIFGSTTSGRAGVSDESPKRLPSLGDDWRRRVLVSPTMIILLMHRAFPLRSIHREVVPGRKFCFTVRSWCSPLWYTTFSLLISAVYRSTLSCSLLTFLLLEVLHAASDNITVFLVHQLNRTESHAVRIGCRHAHNGGKQ